MKSIVFGLVMCLLPVSGWAEDCSIYSLQAGKSSNGELVFSLGDLYEKCRTANALEEIARKMPEPGKSLAGVLPRLKSRVCQYDEQGNEDCVLDYYPKAGE